MKKVIFIKGKGKYVGMDDKFVVEIKKANFRVICKLTLYAYAYGNLAETLESKVIVSGDEAIRETCGIDALKFLVAGFDKKTKSKILKSFNNG